MPDDHRVPQLAGISLILTFKQARVVDAIGDVVGVQAEISELRREARESDDKDTNKEEIEELMKEDLPAEQEDAQNAFASLHNGSVIWTVLSQSGGAIFGLGIISIFPMENENERIRSTALLLMTNTGSLFGGAAL